MMERNKSFLSYVAADLLKKYGHDLSHVCVVFPNKRASLFLDNELMDQSAKPLWSPRYTTISELFRLQSHRIVADPIKSICDLHKCYLECTGMDESLDLFYGWGQLLLADFDDVDKNLANPDRVYANVKDQHYFDDTSFLGDTQKEALKRFFSNWTDYHDTKLKERFLRLWSQLGTIYHHFNDCLSSQGLGYEGSIFREVAESSSLTLPHNHYIFVGFHVLSASEKKLFNMVKAEKKAHFYWDFDNYYLKKDMNESDPGYYINQQLTLFPNEFGDDEAIYDNFRRKKNITFISAPSQDIQARYVDTWLKSTPTPSARPDTAIVLCDESLLPSVIHSMPSSAGSINITSGLPLRLSPVYSFVMRLIEMQTIGHPRNTDKYRLTYVKNVLLHPLTVCISEAASHLLQELQNARRYFPTRQELQDDEKLSLLFMDIDTKDDETKTYSSSRQMLSYLTAIIKLLGKTIDESTQKETDPLLKETVYRVYTILNRLSGLIDSGDLSVDIITLQRLFTQIVDTTTVPFHGEPAVGLQVMGVLETRNLDFKHLLVLSCNEKNMPKASSSTSLIPYVIRQAYGLSTPEHQSTIYSYYFYRMLQRAEDVTFVYCNVPDNRHSGEMSRFMLQMLVDATHTIERKSLLTEIKPLNFRPEPIEKDDVIMEKLRQRFTTDEKKALSPTAINRYLRCPLIFYYNYLCNIKEPNDTDEDIDNMMFGSIFHKAAEILYKFKMPHQYHVDKCDVEYALHHHEIIEQCVDEAFNEEYFNIKGNVKRVPEYNGLQLLNRSVIIKYLKQLLNVDQELAPFTIKFLEKDVYDELTLFAGTADEHHLKYGGVIDRWDQETDEDGTRYMRVLDYKTGSKVQGDLPDVEAIFSQDYISKHSDYYLQTFIYSLIVSKWHNEEHQKVRPALLFIQKAAAMDYNPILKIGKKHIDDVAIYRDDFMKKLQEVVEEMFNPKTSFEPTQDEKRCNNCPYRKLCY